VRDAFLEVRRTNRAAIALYHDLGFECVGTRRGYYQARMAARMRSSYRLELGALAT
jgi:ribosomal protein S18 acetylase RimI-like enzyme